AIGGSQALDAMLHVAPWRADRRFDRLRRAALLQGLNSLKSWGDASMKRSDRILTTHTGSLPRPKPLAELLVAKDQGQAYDAAALAAAVRAAVLDIVRRQVETGI